MITRKRLIVSVLLLGVVGAWYMFRPELLFIDSRVSESLPGTANTSGAVRQPVVLASGRFHSVAHPTAGSAMIYQLADNTRLLRLSDFATSNGPAVFVYLVALPDASDNRMVSTAEKVDLGPLKGNLGDQNYVIPPNLDLTKYQSVTIWCQRFGVNFATASLGSTAP
jgi:hypothetical protein